MLEARAGLSRGILRRREARASTSTSAASASSAEGLGFFDFGFFSLPFATGASAAVPFASVVAVPFDAAIQACEEILPEIFAPPPAITLTRSHHVPSTMPSIGVTMPVIDTTTTSISEGS